MKEDSIIKDWSKLQDWELAELVSGRIRTQTEESRQLAILELARRRNLESYKEGEAR